MDLRQINDLIAIKQYAVIMMNSMTIERSMLKFLSGIVQPLDAKIVELLSSTEFQNYLNGIVNTAPAPEPVVKREPIVRRSKPTNESK